MTKEETQKKIQEAEKRVIEAEERAKIWRRPALRLTPSLIHEFGEDTNFMNEVLMMAKECLHEEMAEVETGGNILPGESVK